MKSLVGNRKVQMTLNCLLLLSLAYIATLIGLAKNAAISDKLLTLFTTFATAIGSYLTK